MRGLTTIVQRVWNRECVVGASLWAVLVPPALLYALAASCRNRLYDRGWWRQRRVRAAVVSVGNLTVGGTGKTPVVLWLASALHARGHRVAILSRGYRRRGRGVRVIADAGRCLVGVDEAGDEAALLGRRGPGLVIVGERRAAAAAAAVEHGAEVLILDDGFQHRALARDLNLLLLDADRPLGGGWTLPAGPLRESGSGAGRADAVLLVARETEGVSVLVPRPRSIPDSAETKPVFRANVKPRALIFATHGEWIESPLERLAGRRLLAVSGIACAERFHHMIAALGGDIIDSIVFGDHHRYDRADWRAITGRARAADLIVTTEKDLVKLERFPFSREGVAALRIGVELEEKERLLELVSTAIDGFRSRYAGLVP